MAAEKRMFFRYQAGQNFRRIRTRIGMTRHEAAELMRCDYLSLVEWEAGRALVPVESAIPFCEAAGCSLDEIYLDESGLSVGRVEDARLLARRQTGAVAVDDRNDPIV